MPWMDRRASPGSCDPSLKDPRAGSIAKDAFLETTEVDPNVQTQFNCLQQTGQLLQTTIDPVSNRAEPWLASSSPSHGAFAQPRQPTQRCWSMNV